MRTIFLNKCCVLLWLTYYFAKCNGLWKTIVYDSGTRLVWLNSWEDLLRGTIHLWVCVCCWMFTLCNICSCVNESLWSGVSAWIDTSPGRWAACCWWLHGASWSTQHKTQDEQKSSELSYHHLEITYNINHPRTLFLLWASGHTPAVTITISTCCLHDTTTRWHCSKKKYFATGWI